MDDSTNETFIPSIGMKVLSSHQVRKDDKYEISDAHTSISRVIVNSVFLSHFVCIKHLPPDSLSDDFVVEQGESTRFTCS